MAITALPSDVIILIIHHLTFPQLSSLARTCKFFNAMVSAISITILFDHPTSKSLLTFNRCTSLDGQAIYVRTLAPRTVCPVHARIGMHALRCAITHWLIVLGHGQALWLGHFPVHGLESYSQSWRCAHRVCSWRQGAHFIPTNSRAPRGAMVLLAYNSKHRSY
jgi:hypothetical protein